MTFSGIPFGSAHVYNELNYLLMLSIHQASTAGKINVTDAIFKDMKQISVKNSQIAPKNNLSEWLSAVRNVHYATNSDFHVFKKTRAILNHVGAASHRCLKVMGHDNVWNFPVVKCQGANMNTQVLEKKT